MTRGAPGRGRDETSVATSQSTRPSNTPGRIQFRFLSQVIEAIVGVLQWLGGFLFKSYSVSRAHSRDHDITVFQRANAQINEASLHHLLNLCLYNRWCSIEDIEAVGHFCSDSRMEENQYLDRRLNRAAHSLVGALARVNPNPKITLG